MLNTVRLELVDWSNGVTSVSGKVTVTRSSGRRSSSATIWARLVSVPWPISTLLVSRVAEPSAFRRTVAVEFEGVIVVLIITASPLPRTSGPGGRGACSAAPCQSIARATSCRQSARPTDWRASPVTKVSPSPTRFFWRSASGSIPSRRAMSSIWHS